MKKIFFVITLLGLVLSVQSYAQSGLKPGDSLPPIYFAKMVNYPTKTLHVQNDLSDKLVILDYWNRGCYPCMGDFPRLDTLQRKFSESIQIIPWTVDPVGWVASIFAKINSKYQMILPSAAEADLPIYGTFENYQQKIWIKGGQVRAVTSKELVTEQHIEAALRDDFSGIYEALGELKELENVYDFSQSVLHQDILFEKETDLFMVKLTKGIEGVTTKKAPWKYDSSIENYGVRHINVPLFILYDIAYDLDIFDCVVELDKDLKYFIKPAEYDAFNTYCLEIISKQPHEKTWHELKEASLKIVREGLDEVFKIQAVQATRKVEGFILKEITGNNLFKTKAGDQQPPKPKHSVYTPHVFELIDEPASELASSLYYRLRKWGGVHHYFNEMEYSGNVTVDFVTDLSDFEKVKAALAEYGLDLSIGEREKEVTVIKHMEL